MAGFGMGLGCPSYKVNYSEQYAPNPGGGGGGGGSNGDASTFNDTGLDFNFNVSGTYFTSFDGSTNNDTGLDFDLEDTV